VETIARVVAQAQERLGQAANYRVRMVRQERVGDRLLPEETVLLNVRREPLGIRLEWPEGPNSGREVLYSQQECGGMMHVKLGASSLLPPLRLAPESPMAMQNSRHPIHQAGFDPILADLARQVAALQAGEVQPGTMNYEAAAGNEPGGAPVHRLTRVGPDGTTWLVDLDQATLMPVLLRETDPRGELVEQYEFGPPELDLPDLRAATAFDPASRWPAAAGGFLGRLARSAAGAGEGAQK
jgi:hypothetical protein